MALSSNKNPGNNFNYFLVLIVVSAIGFFLPLQTAVMAALAIPFTVAILLNSQIGVLLLVFFRQTGVFFSVGGIQILSINKILSLLLLAIIAVNFFVKKNKKFWLPEQFFPLAGFLLVATISGIANSTGFERIISIASQLAIMATIIYLSTSMRHIKNIFVLIAATSLFLFFLGIIQGKGLEIFAQGISTIENRNDLATTAAIAFSLACMLFIRQKNRDKEFSIGFGKQAFYLLCVAASAAIVLFSLSRGALVGIIFSLIALLWHYPRERIWVWIIVLVAGALFLFPSTVEKITQRFGEIEEIDETGVLAGKFVEEQKVTSGETRTIAALKTIAVFASSPILGVGLDNSRWLIGANFPFPELKTVPVNNVDSHNIYLEILAETGIFGFIFYALFLIYTLRQSRKTRKFFEAQKDEGGKTLAAGAQIAFASFLVMGLFLNDPFSFQLLLLAGIIIALNRIALENRHKILSWS